MPQSSHTGNLEFDPEIEKKVKRLAKEAKLRKQQVLSPSSPGLNLVVDLSRSFCDLEEHIFDQLLIQYFYERLSPMDRSMVDVASSGALLNKTIDEATRLISNMAENCQQFGARTDGVTRRVNEAAKICGICTAPGHPTDMCPTLQENSHEQANVMGGFSGPPQRRNDAPTYNPGWRNHSNFSYASKLPGKLPAQVIPNPKESACVMTLRSSKEMQSLILQARKINEEKVNEEFEKKEPSTEKVSHKCDASKTFEIDPPFPSRMAKTKKEETEKEILDTFRKVEINIPLLDVIKQLPKYAKFLKGLCTNRNKLNNDDKIRVGENVSAALQRKLPQKCKDLDVLDPFM
ncbi:uncharacterized protein LOC113774490 [Coffea eugenioides]|uniref:uncharacterized protein LOC113774490 n=1 Tax=Coffea eugenioides TaxID=49369 RepID=UPI000F60B954|nr:uncharacterized protein LOC113774490 [Coffea eugenioides]